MYPHRPAEQVHGREVVSFATSHGPDSSGLWVGFLGLAELFEWRYHSVTPEARAAVDELVNAFEELAYADGEDGPREAVLAIVPLRVALEQLGAEGFDVPGRVEGLLALLRRHVGCCDTISIRKIWGW